jgi:predicted transcriptional regulator
MDSKTRILEVLEEYVHRRKDREIMAVYLTNHPGSLERIAEECDVEVSTVKRTINRNSFIYKYIPESDPQKHRKQTE